MGVQEGGWANGELHRTRKTNLQFLQPVFIEDLPNYMPNTLLGVEDRIVNKADKNLPFMKLILCFGVQSGERKTF